MGKRKKMAFPSRKISSAKARTILREGSVRGHALSTAQKGMFGAAAGRRRKA